MSIDVERLFFEMIFSGVLVFIGAVLFNLIVFMLFGFPKHKKDGSDPEGS